MPSDLLSTKLLPPQPRTDFISRPRLLQRIGNPKRGRVTLITAPAGYGKTTLLAEWCGLHKSQIAWLSLDAADNDPALFWRYIAAALRLDITVGQAATPTTILNLLAKSKTHVTLVLDDFHVIDNKAILDGVALLVDRAPHNLSLVFASRTVPELPLARWRARGELNEVETRQLAFTRVEARAFLQTTMQLDLDAEAVSRLEKMTEGWAAALQLAALTIQVQGVNTGTEITRGHIFDYLAAEVLRGQSQARQAFLLQTSILDRFNADLANAVTGRRDSRTLLRRLVQANLFITAMDVGQTWYRYHPLFADFLQRRLDEQAGAKTDGLHLRAAKWFAGHGLLAEAIPHALRARAYTEASHWMDQASDEAMQYGQLATILGWLDALPRDIVANSSSLELWYGWSLCLERRFDEMETHLANAEKRTRMLERKNPSLNFEAKLVRGKCAAVRARAAASVMNEKGALQWSARALAQLPKQIRNERSVAWMTRGETFERLGKRDEAEKAYVRAAQDSRASEHPFIHIGVLTAHARLLLRQDEKPKAQVVLRRAVEFAREKQVEPMVAAAQELLQGLAAPQNRMISPDTLSGREQEILDWMARGESNPRIAARLGIGVGTVNWHTKNIYKKLGVRNRTQAAALARKP